MMDTESGNETFEFEGEGSAEAISIAGDSSFQFWNDDRDRKSEDDGKVYLNRLWIHEEKLPDQYAHTTRDEEEDEESTLGIHYYSDLGKFQYDLLKDDERQELITKLTESYNQTKTLVIKNKFLHKFYLVALRSSPKVANSLEKFSDSKIYQNIRYQKALQVFESTWNYVNGKKNALTKEMESLDYNFINTEQRCTQLFEDLIKRQDAFANKIKPSKLRLETWQAAVDEMLDVQKRRAKEVSKIRLSYIKLHCFLQKMKRKLQGIDNLDPGFSLMDYEFLLKRKEVYGEKRDEQRELMKKVKESNFAIAASVKHFNEEIDVYDENIRKEIGCINELAAENYIRHHKAVELVKEKGHVLKNIAKLREEIGLLDNPQLLGKMEYDLKEISKLRAWCHLIEAGKDEMSKITVFI